LYPIVRVRVRVVRVRVRVWVHLLHRIVRDWVQQVPIRCVTGAGQGDEIAMGMGRPGAPFNPYLAPGFEGG
jgi:hypothetical protein